MLPTGTVLWSVPHPLSAASQPCRFFLGGGGRCPPLPTFIPHPWGGGSVCGGGGGLVVFPSLHACRRHDASTAQARGAAPVPLQGGGIPCGCRRRPSYPAFAPPVVSPLGLARRVLSTGTVVWSVPHPLATASPPCRYVLGGGGRCSPPPTCIPHPWGGGGVWGGGGGRPCRLPSVARTSQARRKHGAGTRRGTCPSVGDRGLAVCHPSSPLLPYVRTPGGRRPFVARMSQARGKHDASTG